MVSLMLCHLISLSLNTAKDQDKRKWLCVQMCAYDCAWWQAECTSRVIKHTAAEQMTEMAKAEQGQEQAGEHVTAQTGTMPHCTLMNEAQAWLRPQATK